MTMQILFISGSPSLRPSRSGALLDHVVARVRLAGVPVERQSVLDIPAEDLIQVRRDGVAAAHLLDRVRRSDAIVVATPVYNASVPGGFKALLDLLPERALHGKPVLPLASGGSAGHQLAVEYSLKPVLSALGARHVLAGVFACDGDVHWQPGDSRPCLVDTLTDRLDEATDTLLALIGVLLAPPRPGASPLQIVPAAPVQAPFDRERCSA